jgi:hypothetical protein
MNAKTSQYPITLRDAASRSELTYYVEAESWEAAAKKFGVALRSNWTVVRRAA